MSPKVLLLQPFTMRLEIGGWRTPTNRSGVILKQLAKNFEVVIGTGVASSNKKQLADFLAKHKNVKYAPLQSANDKVDADVIVHLCGTFHYPFPPSEAFDDKHRTIAALNNSDVPVVHFQDEYITGGCGYPASVQNFGRIKTDFKNCDTLKGRHIVAIMQTPYAEEFATEAIAGDSNMYAEYDGYKFVYWSVAPLAFSEILMKPIDNFKNRIAYVGVPRPGRTRLFDLLDHPAVDFYGRWDGHNMVNKFKHNPRFNKKVNVKNVPDVYSKSVTSVWTHDDKLLGWSLESARLFEAVRSGSPLLLDAKGWAKPDDQPYPQECFVDTKSDVIRLAKRFAQDHAYRTEFVEAQQQAMLQLDLDAHMRKFSKIVMKASKGGK